MLTSVKSVNSGTNIKIYLLSRLAPIGSTSPIAGKRLSTLHIFPLAWFLLKRAPHIGNININEEFNEILSTQLWPQLFFYLICVQRISVDNLEIINWEIHVKNLSKNFASIRLSGTWLRHVNYPLLSIFLINIWKKVRG